MYIRRKIYSEIDDEFVPVNETLGDYSENLYSVTMTEEELALFSELREELYSSDNYYQYLSDMSKADQKAVRDARLKNLEAAFADQPKNGELITDSLTKGEKKMVRMLRGEAGVNITDAELRQIAKNSGVNKKVSAKDLKEMREGFQSLGQAFGTDVKAPVVYTDKKAYDAMVKANRESYKKAPKMSKKEWNETVKAGKKKVASSLEHNKMLLQNAADARAFRAAQAEAAAQAAKKAARNAKLAKYGKYGAIGLGSAAAIGGGVAAYKHYKNKD